MRSRAEPESAPSSGWQRNYNQAGQERKRASEIPGEQMFAWICHRCVLGENTEKQEVYFTLPASETGKWEYNILKHVNQRLFALYQYIWTKISLYIYSVSVLSGQEISGMKTKGTEYTHMHWWVRWERYFEYKVYFKDNFGLQSLFQYRFPSLLDSTVTANLTLRRWRTLRWLRRWHFCVFLVWFVTRQKLQGTRQNSLETPDLLTASSSFWTFSPATTVSWGFPLGLQVTNQRPAIFWCHIWQRRDKTTR